MTEEECEADDQRRQRERFRSVDRAKFDPGHVAAWMSCIGREALLVRTLISLEFHRWPGKRSYSKDWHKLKGQAQTFFTLLRSAAETVGFTYLTLFEDDVVGAKNALMYIGLTKIPDDVAMVSWFHRLAPNTAPRTDEPYPCWMFGPAHEFSHQQAITLSAATVHALLASEHLKNWSEPHGADMLIGQVMPDAKIAYHFPNIVDHVGGEQSLTGNTGPRRSATFVGEDFDAFDLTRKP